MPHEPARSDELQVLGPAVVALDDRRQLAVAIQAAK